MRARIQRVRLDPGVLVRSADDAALELEDRRTGFRVVLEEIESDQELERFLAEVGMLAGSGEDVARQRQHVFQQDQAWSERLARVGALLERAVEEVPFYRARPQLYARRIQSVDQLRELPLLRRAELKSHMLELCSERVNFKQDVATGRLELASTSGTTDERVQAFADSTLTRVPANYPELWGVPQREDAPRTAVLTSPFCMADRCTRGGSFESRISYEHTLFLPGPPDLFALSRSEIAAIAAELERFSPALWLVNPVYAHWLGRQAQVHGIELRRPDAIVSTYQYLAEPQRRGLATHFGAPVFNLYSATELGGCQVGLECSRGRLHAREDHCLVELIGRNGAPVQSGVGAVVVTTLANEVMPLVRYAMGDLAEPDPAPCDCSLQEWPCFTVHGRDRDALYVDGAFVTTRQLDLSLARVEGIDFYSCRQRGPRELEVDVVPALERAFREAALRDALREALPSVSIRVREVSRLEPAPSLKFPITVGHGDNPRWLQA
jgi:phenylacetate-CoA ligase